MIVDVTAYLITYQILPQFVCYSFSPKPQHKLCWMVEVMVGHCPLKQPVTGHTCRWASARGVRSWEEGSDPPPQPSPGATMQIPKPHLSSWYKALRCRNLSSAHDAAAYAQTPAQTCSLYHGPFLSLHCLFSEQTHIFVCLSICISYIIQYYVYMSMIMNIIFSIAWPAGLWVIVHTAVRLGSSIFQGF